MHMQWKFIKKTKIYFRFFGHLSFPLYGPFLRLVSLSVCVFYRNYGRTDRYFSKRIFLLDVYSDLVETFVSYDSWATPIGQLYRID